MLKYLPDTAKIFLLKIINVIWRTSILPKSWKIALIIPARKPGKDANLATSYRPISLTSCVCKIMEKMVNMRLVWYLEKNGFLSSVQYGFRKNRSSIDPLLRLSNHIQQGFAKGKQTIGVFFDLEKAYDTTCRSVILKAFYDMGIRGNMMGFLKEFLTDRFFRVKIGNTISQHFKQEEGVPQGSILSVTCFSAAINNIVKTISAPVLCSLFVDDFAIYVSSTEAESACRYIQKSINAVSKWADDNGFKFSATKTVAIRFTRSRKVERIPTLTLKDSIIPYEDQVKFLGVIFDQKLTWGPHIDKLKLDAKNALNIVKVVSSFDWGADRKTLLKLYDAVCRSKLDYACQIYSSACKTRLKDLNVIHNMGLRICTGAYITSPVESIYVDSNELPLHLRREELSLRYIQRLKCCSDNPSTKILGYCNAQDFSRKNSSKPLQVRLNDEVEDDDLINQKICTVALTQTPPWLMPEINCCDKIIIKKYKSDEEVRAMFYEHETYHKGQIKIYTDGSKSRIGVGSAVICEDEILQARLPNNASVFTAELVAIVEALRWINASDKGSFVIHSDSYSTISALKQFNPTHPIIQKIQEWLYKLHSKYKRIDFCWVPAHVGIQGNEEADKEAKEAAMLSTVNVKYIPYTDMKRPIKSYILEKWQRMWISPLLANNEKYKKIRPYIRDWPSSYQSNRRYEKVLTRLRIGHCRLTHKSVREGRGLSECDHCHAIQTVEHILIDCPEYDREREIYDLGNKSLEMILGETADIEKLMSFLKDINIFYEL